ncbi:efflux RND transporter periplasmic adaptor subunit [Rhodocytophaga rosea]|uniref:Efflux RND transporter periplasmic adaptor subunit n=1 Tax=Rhodocytophaga rosea TaxID=2704465 RepID=A0A6C0GFX0_9BACT|nr:efflux RND transporter periplasmic adaptor subunit [Rhodocytophaga rosea]QHT66857.1 efflux RND transporter periplasmic adaptor subunit [Rhodocytophaga rosea]
MKPLIMHKFLYQLLLFIVLTQVMGYSCTSKKKDTKANTGAATNKPIGAEVYIVKDTTLQEKLNVLGSLVANERVQIVSESARRLIKINFQEGSYVQKGQLLFKLDDAGLQAQLKKLYAQRKLVANDEQRTAALLKLEGVSKQEYERVAGSIESIDADIEYVKVEIAQTEIRAPFGGKTGIRKVSEGAFVTQNMPLVTLEDINLIKVEFAVPEKYANSIGINQQINFRVENSDKLYQATVKVIEPYVDQNTRSLFIRAIANNEDKKLLPGSSATVEVSLNEIRNTVMIPSKALIPSLEGNSVLTIENGKAAKTIVEVGLRTSMSVQITKGLQPGDSVMTTNILRAKPGIAVQAIASK